MLDATPRLKALGHPILSAHRARASSAASIAIGPRLDRLGGSIAAAISAAARGADALRVHDVAETRQALAIWSAIEGEAAA